MVTETWVSYNVFQNFKGFRSLAASSVYKLDYTKELIMSSGLKTNDASISKEDCDVEIVPASGSTFPEGGLKAWMTLLGV